MVVVYKYTTKTDEKPVENEFLYKRNGRLCKYYLCKNDKIRTTKKIIVEIQQKSEKREKEDKMSKPTKEEISRTYEEAAAIDGCPPMRTFWKIMFPMAQSGIVTVTIFNFINIWNEYFLSLIFASSDKLKPVAPGLYGMINSMKYTGDWAGMFAAVIIVFLPTFILYIFLSEKIIGGVTGGIKG